MISKAGTPSQTSDLKSVDLGPTETSTPVHEGEVSGVRPGEVPALGEEPLLGVENLSVSFAVRKGIIKAVQGASFEVAKGETLGLVGESGCGKSTTGKAIVRLVDPSEGKIIFDNQDVARLRGKDLFRLRRRIQMIFQDPHASLDGRMRIGATVQEALDIHRLVSRGERADRVVALLESVGLDGSVAGRYPHEFSGGQRQRIGIARALAVEPELIVADEPVSALDVSVQAQIVNLLADLRERLGLTFLFISHDLRLVAHFAHRVAVMYLGRVVELGQAVEVVREPLHPYSVSLVASLPVADPAMRGTVKPLTGEVPSPLAPPPGCVFHPRCPRVMPKCKVDVPTLCQVGANRSVACHLFSPTSSLD